MLTFQDITVVILLIVFSILGWIGCTRSAPRNETSETHDNEALPASEKKETHGERDHHAGYGHN